MSSTQLSLAGQGTIYVGSGSITVAALAAAAEADYTISDDNAVAGDVVLASPANAMAEQGFSLVAAWVSASGTVKVRVSNLGGAGAQGALVGGANTLYYALIRS